MVDGMMLYTVASVEEKFVYKGCVKLLLSEVVSFIGNLP
jgi:hypothetical protein